MTTGAIRRAKLQLKCHQQQTIAGASCRPTDSVEALKGNIIFISVHGFFYCRNCHIAVRNIGDWRQRVDARLGLATLSQGIQEPLVVKDTVGRPPGELAMSKSLARHILPSVL